jgi:phospholipid/cholesterol/gamma-HCH transport system ATP-binding protein
VDKAPLIEIEGLNFFRDERCIYQDVSLTIPKGKIIAVLGPSGIGKTTLLKLIGGQLKPSSGNIYFKGQDVHRASRKQLFRIRKSMGMLFQSGALFTDISVFDNVAFALREHTKLPESMIRSIVLMKLEAVGLRGAHHMMPSELSGGMRRRVALARSIALEPEMIMYDEPFAGQDPISMGVLVKLIRDLNQALGLTSIIVSHDVEDVFSIADYVYVMAEKSILAEGTPESLQHSNNEKVTQFLKGYADGPVPFHMQAKPYLEELLH